MSHIPDSIPKAADLVDVLVERAKVNKEVRLADGSTGYQAVVDEDIIWTSTGSINSNKFGLHIYALQEFERNGREAYNNMSYARAKIFEAQSLAIGKSFRRGDDGKASENMKDKNNSQSTYIDKINHQKSERILTAKGVAEKTLWDSVMGREAQSQRES